MLALIAQLERIPPQDLEFEDVARLVYLREQRLRFIHNCRAYIPPKSWEEPAAIFVLDVALRGSSVPAVVEAVWEYNISHGGGAQFMWFLLHTTQVTGLDAQELRRYFRPTTHEPAPAA